MKITVVTAGKIKEKYLTAGINEFLKRLGPFANVKIVEINEEKMKDNPSEAEKQQTLQQEGQRLLRQVPEGSYLFVLDVYGQQDVFIRYVLYTPDDKALAGGADISLF